VRIYGKGGGIFRDGHAQNGAQGSFRNAVMSLRTSDLQDCTLSAFHISDSYALFSGEALPAPHTTSGAALRAYLLHRLAGGDTGLDFEVKIARSCRRTKGCTETVHPFACVRVSPS
jgi:hypothetical protein